MRLKTILLIILSTTLLIASAADTQAFQIYTHKGKKVDFAKVVKATQSKQYIFFGEYHDNPIAHWLEFELTRELHAMYTNHFMLGAEMFEADNQFIIDEYLNDLIASKNFQDEVRLWPNYNTDYKPIMEYAKKHEINFIATNIPRRYASMVYKNGVTSLTSLTELAKSYIAPLDKFVFDSTVTCYKELIISMGDHGGVNLAQAQAIKDATMAHFILKATAADPKAVMLHLNGAYHSDNYQGIVYYLQNTVDKEKIMTISCVEQKDINQLESSNEGIADFIVCIPSSMTKTH
ncbi:ChaN family lipoprotein [Crocinitomix sp.]|nr:ChaN family lipoprotein [Crocinitomix sp.]